MQVNLKEWDLTLVAYLYKQLGQVYRVSFVKHKQIKISIHYLFHDGGLYRIETSPLIGKASQLNSFYMIGTSVMKGLNSTPNRGIFRTLLGI